jgi:hypothetical protein
MYGYDSSATDHEQIALQITAKQFSGKRMEKVKSGHAP